MVRFIASVILVLLMPTRILADAEFSWLKKLNDIDPSIIQEAQKAVDGFLKPDKKMIDEVQEIADSAKNIFNNSPKGNFKDIRDIYPDLKLPETSTKPSKEMESCNQVDENFNNTYLYFYSYSMPDFSIKEALRTIIAHNKKCEKQAVLVVNGFMDNDFLKTMQVMHKLMTDLEITDDLPIQMNPDLFERFNVKQVPQMIIEKNGVIGRIKGDISVSYMIEALERAVIDYGKYGNLYDVKEQSVVEFMKAKIAEALEQFKNKAPEIAKKAMTLNKYNGRFQRAVEDRIFYINPAIVLTEDLTDHNGKVLFPAGVVIDPTEYVTLPGKYLFIDGNDEAQIEYAKNGVYEKIIITAGDASKIMSAIGKRVYFLNDLLIQRFNISRLPSIVEQEGRLIRVTEKAL